MEYACGLAGLVLVTANPAFQARELAYMLEQSGAVGLFLVDEFRGNPMGPDRGRRGRRHPGGVRSHGHRECGALCPWYPARVLARGRAG